MSRNSSPGAIGQELLELERGAGKHRGRVLGVHLLQHRAAEHGALRVGRRHSDLQPRRVLGKGELDRRGLQLVRCV